MGKIGNNRSVKSLSSEERKKLTDAIQQIDNALTRVIGERTFVKETVSQLAEDIGLDKKTINRLAKTFHKASFKMDQEEMRVFGELYSSLYPDSQSSS